MDWISQLPDTQTPSWLGLPNNAEKVLLTARGEPYCSWYSVHSALIWSLLTEGNDMVMKLLRMENLDLEDDLEYSAGDRSVGYCGILDEYCQ